MSDYLKWVNPTSRAQFESALDQGMLSAAMTSGAWWLCRRSGKTKTWKTRPTDFRIPIKFGFRGHAYLAPYSLIPEAGRCNWRIANSRQDAEGPQYAG